MGPVSGLNGVAMGRQLVNGNTPLMVAATAGDTKITRKIIDGGAEVNACNRFGSTALVGSAAGGYSDIVAMLLDDGAKVNMQSKQGVTALMSPARPTRSHNTLRARRLPSDLLYVIGMHD